MGFLWEAPQGHVPTVSLLTLGLSYSLPPTGLSYLISSSLGNIFDLNHLRATSLKQCKERRHHLGSSHNVLQVTFPLALVSS